MICLHLVVKVVLITLLCVTIDRLLLHFKRKIIIGEEILRIRDLLFITTTELLVRDFQ